MADSAASGNPYQEQESDYEDNDSTGHEAYYENRPGDSRLPRQHEDEDLEFPE
jgi:hypothetical protein